MSQKKHREYWQKRTEELMLYADRKDIDFFKRLEELYGDFAKEIQKEIFEFYAKYVEDNEISLQEAKKRLRGEDLSDYQQRANEYFKTKNPELLDRLNEQYSSAKVTRLEALNLDLTYQSGLLQGSVAVAFDTYLKQLASYSYRKIMGGRAYSTLNKPALEQLVKTPFDGYNYSQQIWGNVDNLSERIRKTFEEGFIKGLHPREMARNLRKDTDVQRHRAETLIRTDGSMVINNATLKRYNDAGLKYVRIHVHMDERTSDICTEINRQDKLYNLADEIKKPTLPAHYNCRSTYIPDEEELNTPVT